MNYTKLITKKKQYKYSVNICFDLLDEERLAGFIPNITTTEILREYLGGIIRGNVDVHSRILYGSYGTGKSHLLTVMSQILGHINVKSKGFRSFVKLIEKYDKELPADIKAFVKSEKSYLVVPIHSDYSDFGKCITFSLKKELARNEIIICFNGFYDEALELVKKWLDGEESESRLREECAKLKISVEDLENGLSTYNEKFEKIFNTIYVGMSYGAVFNSTAGNMIDNVKQVNEVIKDKYKGIVFIFDEFGRYVEDYGEELKVKSVQDLAEYCDHSGFDNHLILVSHNQLSMYTKSMKKSVSEEWKKVEGRFKTTSINIKYDQCLSLIGHIIPKTAAWDDFKKRFERELNDLYNQAEEFKGFLLPPEPGEDHPFADGFPMHPITLFALDRLSKKVAQNERTFFTYLAGDEENALFGQLTKYNFDEFHFIGLDAIYDYFEVNIKAFKTDEAYATFKKLQCALNKLGLDDDGYQTRILKALAAINIISDSDVLTADRDTLLSVVDGAVEKVSEAIDALEKKKIVKYMRQYGQYDFFDSSIFDLEEMIEEKVSGISDEMVITTLNEEFADFVLYPHSYNAKFHINRVFVPVFASKDDLTKKSFQNALPRFYDGLVWFVLEEQADIDEYTGIKGIPVRSVLLVNNKSKELEEDVKRYIAIKYYNSKSEELAKDDPTVVGELSLYLSEQASIVEDAIRKWRSLKGNQCFVIYDGAQIIISSAEDLTKKLSQIMQDSFDKTLIVNNDLLTKNSLTGAIKQARKKALEGIMGNINNIFNGCSNLSPEYNIIRATLSKNGIAPADLDPNPVGVLNAFDDGTVCGLPVMNAINKVLRKAQKEQLPLKKLYEMLKEEPYGLRDGYIPILVAYALREYQNVSLYFHGNEHSYTGEELIKALEESENYTLFICNWSAEETTYIEVLERIFKAYLPNGDSLNRLEDLFKAVNAHYASVSKSARTTEAYVSDLAKEYRRILSISYKDYNGFFFTELPKLNRNLQELAVQIENIKKELESVNEKMYIRALRVIKQVFSIDDERDLVEAIQDFFRENWEQKSQKAFDYTTNAMLDVVSRACTMEEREFVDELAKAVTGFELTYWGDSKVDDFEEILKESICRVDDYDPSLGLQDGEMKITIESADGNPLISQFSQNELSTTGQTLLNKMKSSLGNFGGSVSYEEKINIITQLLKEIIG